jgi:hypothetical protein
MNKTIQSILVLSLAVRGARRRAGDRPAGRWRAQALSRPGRKAEPRREQRQRKETLLASLSYVMRLLPVPRAGSSCVLKRIGVDSGARKMYI